MLPLSPKFASHLSRREFLLWSAAASGWLAVRPVRGGEAAPREQGLTVGLTPIATIPEYCGIRTYNLPPARVKPNEIGRSPILLQRSDDLLRIEVEFVNTLFYETYREVCWCVRYRCQVCQQQPNRCAACIARPCVCDAYMRQRYDNRLMIRPADATRPGFLIYHFPPQHVAEDSVLNQKISCDGKAPSATKTPLDSLLGDPTRLVFSFHQPLEASWEGLLNWSQGGDLRVLDWGDGTRVPAAGTDLWILGVDRKGLLHIRVFDAAGKLVQDTDESRLPAQAAAIASLKQKVLGSLPPRVLTSTEKELLITQASSIASQARSGLKPSLVPVAIPNLDLIRPDGSSVKRPEGDAARPRKPEPLETQIILPSGLVLSPHEFLRWDHAIRSVKQPDVDFSQPRSTTVELWETRSVLAQEFVASNPDSPLESLQTLRAVHSYLTDAESKKESLRLLPAECDRAAIVQLNAGFQEQDYRPTPLEFQDLRLSSLGGSVKLLGSWPLDAPNRPAGPFPSDHGDPCPSNVTEYKQDTVQGRDQYVHVSRFYVSCPIPVYVILTEERTREFLPATNDRSQGRSAILLTRWFSKHIPAKEFPAVPDGERRYGRRWPFSQIEFEWPNDIELREPKDELEPELKPELVKGWWMRAKCSDEPLRIKVTATDRQGKRQKFELPLLLLRPDIAKDPAKAVPYLELYHSSDALRWVELGGQLMGLVPLPGTERPGAPPRGSFATKRIKFNVEVDDRAWHDKNFPPNRIYKERPSQFPEAWRHLAYYPALSDLEIRLREAEAYSSGGGGLTQAAWNPIYTTFGFDTGNGNAGELFLDLIQPNGEPTVLPLAFAGDKGGGVVSPSQNIQSLSRSIGTVGGTAPAKQVGLVRADYQSNDFAKGKFNPEQFIPTEATLIGGIKLKDVLKVIDQVGDLADVPQLASDTFADIQDAIQGINELGSLIGRISQLATSFDPSVVDALRSLGSNIRDEIQQTLVKPFADEFLRQIDTVLQRQEDDGDQLSFQRTFLILAESLQDSYPNKDLNVALLGLKDLFSVDTLTRTIVVEPVTVFKDELKRFDPRAILLPKDQLKDLADIVQDPSRLLDGSFLQDARALLASLGLGKGGLTAVLQNLVEGFRSRLETAMRATARQVERSLLDQKIGTIGRLRTFFDGEYHDAIDPAISPAAHIRLKRFDDYLTTTISAPMQRAVDGILEEVDEILGRIPIEPLKQTLAAADAALAGFQKGIEEVLSQVEKLLDQIPRSIAIRYEWDTELKPWALFLATNADGSRRARLKFKSIIEKKLGFSQQELLTRPTARASVRLSDFQILLIPGAEFLTVGFNELLIESDGLQKPKVNIDIASVEFSDSLAFVRQLASLFSPDSGFTIGVSPQGISAGYRFAIPNFSVGVFNLADLALGVSVVLPFDSRPLGLIFSISDRDRPCLLTVGILGGTAFFRLWIEARGAGGAVREIEAAVEFGAVVAANLGPASGRLYVFGGVYYGRNDRAVVFRGFVRAGGCLDVLGLITISAEFYLGLEYRKAGQQTQVFGEARITVRVKIIFVINVSVTITYRKEFQGSKSESRSLAENRFHALGTPPVPPKNGEDVNSVPDAHVPISPSEWAQYCSLFA